MGEEVRVIYNVFHEPPLGWPIGALGPRVYRFHPGDE